MILLHFFTTLYWGNFLQNKPKEELVADGEIKNKGRTLEVGAQHFVLRTVPSVRKVVVGR